MTKTKLTFEPDCDYLLIAISCHQKNHKVAWSIGKVISCSFEKTTPHLAYVGRSREMNGQFDHYIASSYGGHLSYHLLANQSSSGLLIPEEKQADFFLVITGLYKSVDQEQLIQLIKSSSIVLTAYTIEPDQLKSKDKLILE
jgi:hypothetical protein